MEGFRSAQKSLDFTHGWLTSVGTSKGNWRGSIAYVWERPLITLTLPNHDHYWPSWIRHFCSALTVSEKSSLNLKPRNQMNNTLQNIDLAVLDLCSIFLSIQFCTGILNNITNEMLYSQFNEFFSLPKLTELCGGPNWFEFPSPFRAASQHYWHNTRVLGLLLIHCSPPYARSKDISIFTLGGPSAWRDLENSRQDCLCGTRLLAYSLGTEDDSLLGACLFNSQL